MALYYNTQFFTGQKATENPWREMVLQIILHTTLYPAINTINTNVLAVFKQYLVFVQKQQYRDLNGDLPVQSAFVSTK